MGKIGPFLCMALSALMLTDCAKTPVEAGKTGEGPPAVEINAADAVTVGGNGQAVLSLHKRYAGADTCKYGLTLTNRLPYKIANITFVFTADLAGDVPHQSILRNFFEIHAGAGQYREIEFSGLSCDAIDYLEITDPGRCTLGRLKRPLSRPGDCIRQVHIAATPYVKLVRKPPPEKP